MSPDWERVLAEAGVPTDSLGIAAGLRLLRSPWALRCLRWIALNSPRLAPRYRPGTAFALDLIRRLYTARGPERVVWASIMAPAELFWGLGLTPFYPEAAAAAAGWLGLTARGLARAGDAACPVDLCTVHRAAFGLARDGLFPPGAAFVSTSHLCGVAGMMLAGEARRSSRPFHLIDVPPTADAAALDYVEGQLVALVRALEETTGVRYDPHRLRGAIRRSNEARAFAVEINELRACRPSPVRGSQMFGNIGLFAWLLGHRDGVSYFRAWRDYTAERVRRRDPEQARQKVRLCWMHIGPYFASGLVEHLEEDLGAAIAFEEHSSVWWDVLDEDRPLRSLAARIVGHPGNGPIERRLESILEHVARYQCDGVIHFSHWGCRQSAGAVRVLRDGLRREGIPLLDLEGDCLDPTNMQIGPLRTRIEAFVETLV